MVILFPTRLRKEFCTYMPIWLSLILVVLFLLMNAFFVIAEFSLVRVRKSQIEILVEEGKKGAKRALRNGRQR